MSQWKRREEGERGERRKRTKEADGELLGKLRKLRQGKGRSRVRRALVHLRQKERRERQRERGGKRYADHTLHKRAAVVAREGRRWRVELKKTWGVNNLGGVGG
jgi:hypothetical protein